jgi:hypothetical protein
MDFDSALNRFLSVVNSAVKRYAEKHYQNLNWSDTPGDPNSYFSPLLVEAGSKYLRIVSAHHGSRSVYCFIRKADGAIMKASSWKVPAKGERFNIFKPEKYEGLDMNLQGTGWLYAR